MKEAMKYDIIGDIHGQAGVLRDLLDRLGYVPEARHGYRHPDRKAIFLGDYVDRGPAIRETLQIVRAMEESGAAIALCGNHEMDILMHDTPDGRGGWLRPRGGRFTAMHARTHQEFEGLEDEWRDWLRWIQRLPLALELPGLRVVHACWHSEYARRIAGRCLDDDLLRNVADRRSSDGRAVRMLLSGPMVPLPDGILVNGGIGRMLDELRVRWWVDGRGSTYREACINRHESGPDLPIPAEYESLVTPVNDGALPVFVGHYWLAPERPKPVAPSVACVDFSVSSGGPLVAYRWDGERVLDAAKFVYDPARIEVQSGKRSVDAIASCM